MTKRDFVLIRAISARGSRLLQRSAAFLALDLVTCHLETPLNLAKLHGFPDSDFVHDVAGINQHLDRETGELTNCFWPRCGSAPEAGEEEEATNGPT